MTSNTYSDPSVQKGGGKLDFRKLAIFIVIAGVLVISYGGLIYYSNSLPVSTFKHDPNKDIYTEIMRAGTYHPELEKMLREEGRQYGIKVIILGIVIAVVGIAIIASIKKE